MRRYVVECDICGEEVHDWYEVKMKYVSFNNLAEKTTRRNKMIICWNCREGFIKCVRNWRSYER